MAARQRSWEPGAGENDMMRRVQKVKIQERVQAVVAVLCLEKLESRPAIQTETYDYFCC